MTSFFLGCFCFGAFFTVISAVLGGLDGAHGSPGHHHDLAVAHGHEAWWTGAFSVSSVVAFLTWFGGLGWVLTAKANWALVVAVPAAVAAGMAGSALIMGALRWIRRGDRPMRPEDYALDGTVARVSVSIPENGVGEIVFSLAGVRRSEAARSLDGRRVESGEEVLITHLEKGTAMIQPVRRLLEPDAERREQRRGESQQEP